VCIAALALLATSAACSTDTSGPSKQAKLVCSSDAQQDIRTATHLSPSRPPVGHWSHGTYTCPYALPGAPVVLSVHDLATLAATTRYYNQQAAERGRQPRAEPLSIGANDAFVTTDGSVVARKDTHVLLVDISAVPASFFAHQMHRAELAIVLAATIMACWSGT
jgi:hypothetical protein